MKQITSTLMAVSLLLSGCATGTHIITGAKHQPIKPQQVVLYQLPPAKFELVGIVNAHSPGIRQHNMDDAVDQLKRQAAEIGANGVLLGGVNPGGESVGVATGVGFAGARTMSATSVSVAGFGIQISGQAIYVAP